MELAEPPQLLPYGVRGFAFVRNLDLLRHERSEDAGEGGRIFVANLFECVEALATARVIRLVEGIA